MIHTDGIPTIAMYASEDEWERRAAAQEDVRPPCRIRGRDWAGRSMTCVREDRHSGSHVGSTGGRLARER